MCWGLNDKGQLGIGNTTDMNAPTAVRLSAGVDMIPLNYCPVTLISLLDRSKGCYYHCWYGTYMCALEKRGCVVLGLGYFWSVGGWKSVYKDCSYRGNAGLRYEIRQQSDFLHLCFLESK